MKRKSVSFESVSDNVLSDIETAQLYLQECLNEGDDDLFMKAIGDVIRAHPKGMDEVAAKSGQKRESLYKSLSGKTKPKFNTIYKVLSAMGFQITIQPVRI